MSKYLKFWGELKENCFLKSFKKCSLFFGDEEQDAEEVDINDADILEEQIEKMVEEEEAQAQDQVQAQAQAQDQAQAQAQVQAQAEKKEDKKTKYQQLAITSFFKK